MIGSVFTDPVNSLPRAPRGIQFAIDVNYLPLANIVGPGVPGAGPNLGQRATNALGGATNPFTQSPGGTPAGAISGGPGRGFLGQPLMWWVVFAGAVFVVWWIAERGGQREDFSNPKMSLITILLLSTVPLVGIPVWKTVINSLFPQSAVATFVNAA